jgi:hypothetical protein
MIARAGQEETFAAITPYFWIAKLPQLMAALSSESH